MTMPLLPSIRTDRQVLSYASPLPIREPVTVMLRQDDRGADIIGASRSAKEHSANCAPRRAGSVIRTRSNEQPTKDVEPRSSSPKSASM